VDWNYLIASRVGKKYSGCLAIYCIYSLEQKLVIIVTYVQLKCFLSEDADYDITYCEEASTVGIFRIEFFFYIIALTAANEYW